MTVEERLSVFRRLVDERLDAVLPEGSREPSELHTAMRYAVMGEGKRIRPALAMASSVAVGGSPEDALPAACSVELLHCFSLVHDDLPAIDDDDLRRGRPTLHRAFGEAVALLAGDALFALAFQCLADSALEPVRLVTAFQILAGAAGSQGLVGGEVLDVLSERQPPMLPKVRTVHELKTATLISASCQLGALFAGTDEQSRQALASFGRHLGLGFQIVDDILNETSTVEELGKAAGSDRHLQKATYVACLGVSGSERAAAAELECALACLEGLPGDREPLAELARYSVDRRR